jgi:hypothetical protein
MTARFETLAKWVNEYGWTFGVELGVSYGQTHLYLLEHCPDLLLVGVDGWDLDLKPLGPYSSEICRCATCQSWKDGRKKMTAAEQEQAVRRGAADIFFLNKGDGGSVLYKMSTEDASKRVLDGSLDFVFIDADHSTIGVVEDISNWWPKLKPTGWMIGHDWNMQSVRDGVLYHFKLDGLEFEDDHLWIKRRAEC